MRTLLLFTILYSNTLLANSFEVEAIHLKNGEIVSVQDESYSSLDEVRAIEIVDQRNTHTLVSPSIFKMLLNGGDAGGGAPMNFGGGGNDPDDRVGGDMGGGSPMRIGGDGSGGSPMMRMSTRAAVRIGGDGSGGG